MSDKTPSQPPPIPEMPSTCQQVTDVIVDYVTEEMDPVTRLAFERHLSLCPDCVAFLNTYQGTIRTMRTVRYETIPADMLGRVEQFLRGKVASPHSS